MEDEQQPQAHSRRSYVYESQGGKRNKKKLFAIIGGILIVLIVLMIAISAFSSDESPEDEDIFATPAITQSPTDTPAPTPEDDKSDAEKKTEDEASTNADSDIDRSDYTILIQNGSGTAGAAGRLADILGDLGYTVGSTENADNFDYTKTEISVANGNSTLLDLLESDLSDEYTIGDTSTDYEGDEDAVVIIGAE